MKRAFLIVFSFLLFLNAFSQNPDPQIAELVNQTSLDSLTKFVRELSGEDSVYINGEKTRITNRIYLNNDLAAEYIKQKLIQFGYTPEEQNFNTTGKNIIARKTGMIYSSDYYILCAHYDAVADYCADDNASGCAAVLEAARLFSDYDLTYTIEFAFWDEEEIGLKGSRYYAGLASDNDAAIRGVINLEMFGWDSDNDGEFEVHVRDYANSLELANTLSTVVMDYELNLTTLIENPGTTSSDHSPFWDEGYGALVYSQSFFNGDSNPYYHTSNDRIDKFNMPYFHELGKLTVGCIATLNMEIETHREEFGLVDVNIYPNPAKNYVKISSESPINIQLLDITGKEIIHNKSLSKNTTLDISKLQSGIYIILLTMDTKAVSRKLLIIQ